MYRDASIGNAINIVMVRLMLLENEALEVSQKSNQPYTFQKKKKKRKKMRKRPKTKRPKTKRDRPSRMSIHNEENNSIPSIRAFLNY